MIYASDQVLCAPAKLLLGLERGNPRLKDSAEIHMTNLQTKLSTLRLSNPTLLASGFLDVSGKLMVRVAGSGAGGVVTKSVAPKPNPGYQNPTVFEVDGGLINAMGLPNPGIDEFLKEMEIVRQAKVPVIGSVYGKNPEEFAAVALKLEKAGASAIELNLSCPHAQKLLEFSQDPTLAAEVTGTVKNNVGIPVFAKLAQESSGIVKVAGAVLGAGADGITAINTIRSTSIDIATRKPVLSNVFGGLSGKAIKPVAVRCVYEIAKEYRVPIMGVGGVYDWKDAVEFILAGAAAVQIGTAITYRGLKAFNEVNEGIRQYMETNGFRSIRDMVGLAIEGSEPIEVDQKA